LIYILSLVLTSLVLATENVCLRQCLTFIKNTVHLLAMRVGFIRGLSWERYGDFWHSLVQGLGVEVQFADPEASQRHFETGSMTLPGASIRCAVAEAFALSEVDVLMAPDLNPEELRTARGLGEGKNVARGKEVARGSGQDPWIASFPQALQTLGGLPPVIGVPATLELNLETLALETLLSLTHDTTKARLVWERNKRNAKPKRYQEPRWSKQPGQVESVAVLAQPWLLVAPLLNRITLNKITLNKLMLNKLNLAEANVISQQQFDPALLREEASRLEKRLIPSDAEVLGAAHYLNRKGTIDKFLMIVDNSSGADLWLEKQVRKIITKPLEVMYLQDIVPEHELVATLLKAEG
jgi:hypothetical protein